ncbi:MAG: hypothetical protein AB1489_13750 [Acidobacteriota bacterium]
MAICILSVLGVLSGSILLAAENNPKGDSTIMATVNRVLPERRLSVAERRAGRRFIAQLMEQFPRMARIAYPVRGEGGVVYVRMPIPPDQSSLIDEFAAALTGMIHEQENIRVLLISDDFPADTPLESDDDLKSAQAQMSCDIDSLRKLRKYQDTEATTLRSQYAERIKAHINCILDYLNDVE